MARRKAERSRHKGHDGAGGMRWLLTYSDMITLLLALFIVLFAEAENQVFHLTAPDPAPVRVASGRAIIGQAPGPAWVPGLSGRSVPGAAPPGTARLARRLRRTLQQHHLATVVQVQAVANEVAVVLAGDWLFPNAHAALRPAAVTALRVIARALAASDRVVAIEGMTDAVPIRTARYPSNWQLGAMRSANVAQVLTTGTGLAPQRVVQLSVSKYHPVASNATAAGRAQNRRVILWVLAPGTLGWLPGFGTTASAR